MLIPQELTDSDIEALLAKLEAEKEARASRNAEKIAWLDGLKERIADGFITADEVRAALGDKPKRTRKPKAAAEEVSTDAPIDTSPIVASTPQVTASAEVSTAPVSLFCGNDRDCRLEDRRCGTFMDPTKCKLYVDPADDPTRVKAVTDLKRGDLVTVVGPHWSGNGVVRIEKTESGKQPVVVSNGQSHMLPTSATYDLGNGWGVFYRSRFDEPEPTPAPLIDSLPADELTQDDIDHALLRCGNTQGGIQRTIDAHRSDDKTDAEFAEFLKREYGEGGGSQEFADGTWGSIWFSAKGIKLDKGDATVLLKWPEVAKRTAQLIDQARITAPVEERKPKTVEINIGAPAPVFTEPHPAFDPKVHVACRDLDNQYGVALIPAMCRQSELFMLDCDGTPVSAVTKAYADEAGFRLTGTLIAAGSTNGGVQDSAHHVQCLSDIGCKSQLTGYCMAEYTCGKHLSAMQKLADAANAETEADQGRMFAAEVDVFVTKLRMTGHADYRDGTTIVYAATLLDGDFKFGSVDGVEDALLIADREAVRELLVQKGSVAS
jgi:hypothetical protein